MFTSQNYVIILRSLPCYAARVSRFLSLSLGNTDLADDFVSLLSCLSNDTCEHTAAEPTPSKAASTLQYNSGVSPVDSRLAV